MASRTAGVRVGMLVVVGFGFCVVQMLFCEHLVSVDCCGVGLFSFVFMGCRGVGVVDFMDS